MIKRLFKTCVALLAIAAAATGPARAQSNYTVKLAEGTEDAGHWTISPDMAATTGVVEGTEVTVTYTGTRKVKSVEATVEYPVTTATPLTFEALSDGTIVVNIGSGSSPMFNGMKYSVNGGEKTLITTTTNINVAAGDKVQFYGNGTSTTAYGNSPEVKFVGTAQTKVYGNVMSLVDEDGFATATTLSTIYTFYSLFGGNTTLTDASQLLLPATTLASSCYRSMFDGCTGLTTPPELPATTLINHCYTSMFSGCSSLTTAPELPATMLVYNCYTSMFSGCSNLSSVTCLATDISAYECTDNWLDGVSATGTFTAASTTNWPEGNNGIPSGWTRVNQ